MTQLATNSRAAAAGSPVQADSAPTPLGRDLSLLTASLLLHIMQIDRAHARRAGAALSAGPTRKPL